MENKKMTTPIVSVGADTEQSPNVCNDITSLLTVNLSADVVLASFSDAIKSSPGIISYDSS